LVGALTSHSHFKILFSQNHKPPAHRPWWQKHKFHGLNLMLWLLHVSVQLVDRGFPRTNENDFHRSSSNPNAFGRRRQFLQNLLVVAGGGLAVAPQAASAGMVGEAVTKSGLGLSVRRSVVRGAQTFDSLDGQWEQFSDRFSLGTERSKRDALPPVKVIPDPQPLDSATDQDSGHSDQVFVKLTSSSTGRFIQSNTKGGFHGAGVL
jgi:hypothetical protein